MEKGKLLAVISLILGVLSSIYLLYYSFALHILNILGGPIAILMGIISLKNMRKPESSYKTMAIIGIALGVPGLIELIMLIVFIIGFGAP